MAERSIFWDTNGTGDGATQYTEADLMDWLRRSYTSGVQYGVDGELAVSGTSSPVTVAVGGAVVYGTPYWNTANVNVAVSTPVLGTTGHRIVLRKSWANQQVRITLLSSSDGVATPPSATQTAGTTWDLTLATLTITTGGVITVTDARTYTNATVKIPTLIETLTIEKDNTLSNTLYSGGQLQLSGNGADTYPAIGFHRLGVDALAMYYNGGADLRIRVNNGADGAIWNAVNDGNNSGLDADLLKGMDIETIQRQGGDSANWTTSGSANYAPTALRIQMGSRDVTFSSVNSAGTDITFPTPFAQPPLIFTSVAHPSGLRLMLAQPTNITANGFRLQMSVISGATISETHRSFWFAIGAA